MRISGSSGAATGQKHFIINGNMTSFYPQTAETRKFRLQILYLFSKHICLSLYSYVSLVIMAILWVHGHKVI